jgi:hypothetical protein
MDLASRRSFLQSGAALAGGLALARSATAKVAAPPTLPTVKFQGADVTKMLIGSNPLYGYSHFNPLLDALMREWMTQDHRIQTLHMAEAAGINTWQVHYNGPCIEDFKRYRDEGGRMNWILLADFDLMKNWKLLPEIAKLGPLGVGHHGNRTDERFRAGQMNIVEDFTKAVHDAGMAAGVSTHNPAVVQYIEDKGWKIEYYMTCLYRISRIPEETRKEIGEAPLGETFLEKDPERMCAMVRKTDKTCFAFKLLGAGRNIRPDVIEGAFRFALTNIKPKDAVIVGMFPKFTDQAQENAGYVRKIVAEMRS